MLALTSLSPQVQEGLRRSSRCRLWLHSVSQCRNTDGGIQLFQSKASFCSRRNITSAFKGFCCYCCCKSNHEESHKRRVVIALHSWHIQENIPEREWFMEDFISLNQLFSTLRYLCQVTFTLTWGSSLWLVDKGREKDELDSYPNWLPFWMQIKKWTTSPKRLNLIMHLKEQSEKST